MALGWWLEAYGFEPVVIEASPRLRNRGYMMDFFGPGIDVARDMLKGRLFSIMRGDLEEVIHGAIGGRVPIRFGTSIRSLEPSENDVAVTFENGDRELFDLVIGADGIHSNVRRLAFGPQETFSHHLGFYGRPGVPGRGRAPA